MTDFWRILIYEGTMRIGRPFYAIIMASMLMSANILLCAICYAVQSDTGMEYYIHHEYLYGTARIDYIEIVTGSGMITHYYKYANTADQFRVTSIEVFSGSRYVSKQPLRIIR